jgi:D-glycerate 3-kinase
MTAVVGDLAARLKPWLAHEARRRPGAVVGVCGPQGSGKSTLCAELADALSAEGLQVATLSLDDLYLPRAERLRLAREVHPLLATRGPPGTHDVRLGMAVLEALSGQQGPVRTPRFDKAADDRSEDVWANARADLILFEGWCLGARPQAEGELTAPVNDLERLHDADGGWRRWVNAALAGDYQSLWSRLDRLIVLQPPSFDVVLAWRLEQEHALRAKLAREAADLARTLSDAQVAVFTQHYERITRALIADPPAQADVRVRLDERRRPVEVIGSF